MPLLIGDITIDKDPCDERLFVFGDQHGCHDQMSNLYDLMSDHVADGKTSRAIFLGDLIDRGPASIRCLDLAIETTDDLGIPTTSICGNHEEMLFSALFGETKGIRNRAGESWGMNGGIEVLKELGVTGSTDDLKAKLGERRLAWLHAMQTSYVSGDLLFVHAGVTPWLGEEQLNQPVGIDLSKRFDEAESTRWVRHPFHDVAPNSAGWLGRHFIFHGHDPDDARRVDVVDSAERLSRINLDGGSYRTGRTRMAIIEGQNVRVYESASQG